MAWSLPQIPPELAQALLMKQPAQGAPVSVPPANPPLPAPSMSGMPATSRMTSPSMAVPPVAPPPPLNMSGAPPANADPMRSAFGIPRMPGAVPPVTSPAPSDDPGITGGMPQLPKAPDLSNSPVLGLAKQYGDTLAKQSAITPPDPNQLKPHWYDRIGGALAGAASGDAQVGANVTNHRMINAAREYAAQTKPLQTQLENIKGGAGIAEAAGKIPAEDLKNKLDIAHTGIEGATQAETARHNQESESTTQQQADTAQAGQEATQEHEQTAEQLEQQRIAQEGKYQTGELAARGQQLGLDKQKFDASVSSIPDLKSLDAEEKADNASIDKAQKESSDAIRDKHKGFTGTVLHPFSSADEEIKDDQARFETMRKEHAASFQQRRAMLSGKGGAPTSAPNPATANLQVGQSVTVDGKPMVIKGFHSNGKPIVGN